MGYKRDSIVRKKLWILKILKYFTEHREESIGKVITVKYNAVIKDKMGNMSLFLPRFVELRSDKLVADSSAKIIAESGTSEI